MTFLLTAIIYILISWSSILIYRFGFNEQNRHDMQDGKLKRLNFKLDKDKESEEDYRNIIDREFEEIMKYNGSPSKEQTADTEI
ncbi:MAG: hypothetical protein RR088_04020 [Clostridia bacterium]